MLAASGAADGLHSPASETVVSRIMDASLRLQRYMRLGIYVAVSACILPFCCRVQVDRLRDFARDKERLLKAVSSLGEQQAHIRSLKVSVRPAPAGPYTSAWANKCSGRCITSCLLALAHLLMALAHVYTSYLRCAHSQLHLLVEDWLRDCSLCVTVLRCSASASASCRRTSSSR